MVSWCREHSSIGRWVPNSTAHPWRGASARQRPRPPPPRTSLHDGTYPADAGSKKIVGGRHRKVVQMPTRMRGCAAPSATLPTQHTSVGASRFARSARDGSARLPRADGGTSFESGPSFESGTASNSRHTVVNDATQHRARVVNLEQLQVLADSTKTSERTKDTAEIMHPLSARGVGPGEVDRRSGANVLMKCYADGRLRTPYIQSTTHIRALLNGGGGDTRARSETGEDRHTHVSEDDSHRPRPHASSATLSQYLTSHVLDDACHRLAEWKLQDEGHGIQGGATHHDVFVRDTTSGLSAEHCRVHLDGGPNRCDRDLSPTRGSDTPEDMTASNASSGSATPIIVQDTTTSDLHHCNTNGDSRNPQRETYTTVPVSPLRTRFRSSGRGCHPGGSRGVSSGSSPKSHHRDTSDDGFHGRDRPCAASPGRRSSGGRTTDVPPPCSPPVHRQPRYSVGSANGYVKADAGQQYSYAQGGARSDASVLQRHGDGGMYITSLSSPSKSSMDAHSGARVCTSSPLLVRRRSSQQACSTSPGKPPTSLMTRENGARCTTTLPIAPKRHVAKTVPMSLFP